MTPHLAFLVAALLHVINYTDSATAIDVRLLRMTIRSGPPGPAGALVPAAGPGPGVADDDAAPQRRRHGTSG
jgi:hypothetical protein